MYVNIVILVVIHVIILYVLVIISFIIVIVIACICVCANIAICACIYYLSILIHILVHLCACKKIECVFVSKVRGFVQTL